MVEGARLESVCRGNSTVGFESHSLRQLSVFAKFLSKSHDLVSTNGVSSIFECHFDRSHNPPDYRLTHAFRPVITDE